MKRVTIDPITRLEGHGKIEIFLDDAGDVENVYFQIPELRGFEQFSIGRPAEEMPRITNRICGVCPEAHHMAATKALDALFHVEPPSAAKKIREMFYMSFYCTDHTVHFYALGAPDFVIGPQGPPAERNILGVIHKVGLEIGKEVIACRKRNHEVIAMLGGRGIHPVAGLPGGWSKAINEEERAEIEQVAKENIDFGLFSLKLEFVKYEAKEYAKHIAERVEPWTYLKYPYLKEVGWKGFVDGMDSGVYCATPLSRLNASDGMATPKAQEFFEKFYETLGSEKVNGRYKPVHHRLATHWARLVELLYAAERMLELATDPEITDPNVRAPVTETPDEGIGCVEAPRGTLTHHYKTDKNGILTDVNLIVGTTNNYAPITMSVKKAAESLINKDTGVTEGLLNMVEMAFRNYDPCMSCATHSLPGQMPLEIIIRDTEGNKIKRLSQFIE